LLPVLKNQNGVYIQDGVENVYIYHPIFSKMIFLSVFLLFFIFWEKIKLLWKNFFVKNSKWRIPQLNYSFNMKDDIFQKKNQDFIISQPLNDMFSFFDML
jgi:hypothetical protein